MTAARCSLSDLPGPANERHIRFGGSPARCESRCNKLTFCNSGAMVLAFSGKTSSIIVSHLSLFASINVASKQAVITFVSEPICPAHQDMERALTEYNRRVEQLFGK